MTVFVKRHYVNRVLNLLTFPLALSVDELLTLALPGEEYALPKLTEEISVRIPTLAHEEAQQLSPEARETLRRLFISSPSEEFTTTLLGVLVRAEDIQAIPYIERLHEQTTSSKLKILAQKSLDFLRPLAEQARTGETLLRPSSQSAAPDTLLRAAHASDDAGTDLLRASQGNPDT